jgi:hypothetical protein
MKLTDEGPIYYPPYKAVKATDGLSDLAKQVLELAGKELSKATQLQLWDLRPAAEPAEVLDLFLKVRGEIQEAKKTEGMREAARIRRLAQRLWDEHGEELRLGGKLIEVKK